jgi:DNA-directed RNA polymerase sigma subunit (sigma70/sigma32)
MEVGLGVSRRRRRVRAERVRRLEQQALAKLRAAVDPGLDPHPCG